MADMGFDRIPAGTGRSQRPWLQTVRGQPVRAGVGGDRAGHTAADLVDEHRPLQQLAALWRRRLRSVDRRRQRGEPLVHHQQDRFVTV